MLSGTESERYLRQIPLIGEEGQEKLRGAKILIVGAGGLGTPAALYLAAAGVGQIRIIDPDRVDRTNLNRQILHTEKDIGRPKVHSAAEKLRALNPEVEIEPIEDALREENSDPLVRGMDLLLDALDNFQARYILNRAAVSCGIPLIHAAVNGLSGQMTTVIPGKTPCLECIFPHPPPAARPPVLGITAGMLGLLQAGEALRLLLSQNAVAANRLLVWDGREASLEYIPMDRDPCCRVCGVERGSSE
jgi:adenylyltransferase/sulfurtransferase